MSFKQHHARRLLELAAFLDDLPRKSFNIDFFVEKPGKDGRVGSCGTVACAIGWAGTIPAFRRAGLRTADRLMDEFEYQVSLGSLRGFDAAESFFGLTQDEAAELFLGGTKTYKHVMNPGPQTVAKAIRRFVAHKVKEKQTA